MQDLWDLKELEEGTKTANFGAALGRLFGRASQSIPRVVARAAGKGLAIGGGAIAAGSTAAGVHNTYDALREHGPRIVNPLGNLNEPDTHRQG